MRKLLRPLWILLALVFLFEAWLWEHLARVVASVVARLPVAAIRRRAAAWIEGLPPAATLVVFIVPVLLLVPFKFLGLWMLARGHWLDAIGVLVLAKMIGLGVTAFIFDLTLPKLLQLAWFRRLYGWVIWALARAHALIDPIKRRVKTWFRIFAPKRAGRMLRLLMRIRRRIQAQSAS